ncbi:TIGR02452 family protein [Pseudoduganella sp. S-14]|uniref:TIGR02452 family protein n=1 Tax=Pseudoduganella sp. S-14 TaxID=3404065 RepID=UPI003CF23ED6
MINREIRSRIARETLSIVASGGYENSLGKHVDIARVLEQAKAGTVHYQAGALRQLVNGQGGRQCFATKFEVRNEATLAAARRLIGLGHADPLCLNFASAKNPGGGFLGGAEAQEENLAKSSGLYPCIVQKPEMYQANRAHKSCIYLDDMIYSPKVPVFRDDDYGLLDEPYLASMVTAPAVNRGAVARNEPERLGELEAAMLARIEMLLALAVHHGHTALVLGAWGCGVFGNQPSDMARWFAMHLLRSPKYRNAFEHVVFAVLDRKGAAVAAFEALFTGEERK